MHDQPDDSTETPYEDDAAAARADQRLRMRHPAGSVTVARGTDGLKLLDVQLAEGWTLQEITLQFFGPDGAELEAQLSVDEEGNVAVDFDQA